MMVILINVLFDMVYVMCVTYVTIHFNNPALLWWYLLVLCTGYSFKSGTKK